MTKALSIQAEVSKDTSLKTVTFLGRDHLVVPVVCLVEGVVQGLNASTPELALASEFGRVVEGWNGRPVVMNHPIVNESPTSANIPEVYQAYTFGMLFNSRIENKKLIADAYIDLARVEELGGEVKSTIDRIQEGTTVEVSTGLFVEPEEVKGRYNGKEYGAIWHNVMPDHLAFLSEGTVGACSVDDGCGTPRANSKLTVNSTAIKWQECGCKHKEVLVASSESTSNPEETEIVIKPNSKGETPSFDFSRFSANAYPNNMIDIDARKLVSEALRASMSRDNYSFIIGISQEKVLYETWDYNNDTYSTYQRGFDISTEKVVTLKDDVEKVVVTMSVTPTQAGAIKPKANSGETVMADNNTPAPATPESTTKTQDPAPTTTTPVTTEAAPTTPATPTVQTGSTAVQGAPRALTTAEFIAQAPEEIRAVLNSGLKMLADKKNAIIQALKSTNRLKIEETRLSAMSIEDLEALAELAAIPRYEGANPGPREITDNANDVPAPPPLIPAKTA